MMKFLKSKWLIIPLSMVICNCKQIIFLYELLNWKHYITVTVQAELTTGYVKRVVF